MNVYLHNDYNFVMNATLKIILINNENKILALRRSGTVPRRQHTWDLPGGVLEHGEILEDAIKRETLEETGVEIDTVTIHDASAVLNVQEAYWIQICYVAKVELPEVILSFEHDEYEWLSKNEFLERESTDRLTRFVSKIEPEDNC